MDEDEKEFLRGLGKFQNPDATHLQSRAFNLSGYISALDKRVVWGHMNKDSIRAFAMEMLSQEIEA